MQFAGAPTAVHGQPPHTPYRVKAEAATGTEQIRPLRHRLLSGTNGTRDRRRFATASRERETVGYQI
jgi:hypothetical protein